MNTAHIQISIERYSFVQVNGDVEEYAIYLFQNDGTAPLSLSGKYLQYDFTDSIDKVIAANDRGATVDENVPYGGCLYGPINGIFRVGLELRGEVAPRGARIIGVHVRRRKLARTQLGESHLEDPVRVRELSAFPGANLDAVVVYSFPPDSAMRDVVAASAKFKTTRLARWEYTPQPNGLDRWSATLRRGSVPTKILNIDDGITGIYQLMANDASGEMHSGSDIIQLLDDIFEDFPQETFGIKDFLINYPRVPFEERQLNVRSALLKLHALRDRIVIETKQKKTGTNRHVRTRPDADVNGTNILERTDQFEFDVALSFAATERKLAKKLAALLEKNGIKTFYDDFRPDMLWGRNLVDHFAEVYGKKSRYCVMFVSRQYQEGEWTTHERQIAQARALKEKGSDYILPIFVDDTEVTAVLPTTGYLSLSKYSIEKIARLLIDKIRSS